MSGINMKKEWRSELAQVRQNRAKVVKDMKAFTRTLERQLKRAKAAHGRELKMLDRALHQAAVRSSREIGKLARRSAILEGRLA